MHKEHIEEMEEGLDQTKLFDENEDNAWKIEKDVHLDGEGQAGWNMVRWGIEREMTDL